MRMIRAVAIMLTLTVTITLVGCVSYVDLSDRAIVQAIGIDYLPDKKVYRISVQYFNQSSEGGQNQIDKTQDNVLKSVGEGESNICGGEKRFDADGKGSSAERKQLIIIGKELRKYKLGDTLEFFVGNYHSHPQAYVAAAEDTAEENCFQTLNIPRATGSTVDKSVLLNESRLYLITDFGAVSEGDPVQNTKAINAAIQAASEAGR